MSQLLPPPGAESGRPLSKPGPRGLLKRYFVVTLVFSMWCGVWLFLDGIYGLWILVAIPLLLPGLGVMLYLVGGLIASMARRDFQRFLSALLGPVFAVLVALLAANLASGFGLSPDYILFSKRRAEFLDDVAKKGGTGNLLWWSLHREGFLTGCVSATLVIHDPSHRLDLSSARHAGNWREQIIEIVQATHCGSGLENATIKRLEGDFYAVRLE